MNAIDLLKQDHRIVDALFTAAENAPPSERGPLFKRIKGALDAHAHVEEKIFYPFLKKNGDKELKKIVLEGIEEHGQMKMFLGQLDGMPPKKEVFEPKLTVMIEDTRHHVREEEGEMFDMAEDQFSEETLEKLGARMEKEKAKFQKENGIKPEDPEVAQGMLGSMVSKAVEAVSGALGADGKSTGKGGSKSGSAKSGSKSGGSKSASGSSGSSRSSSAKRSSSKSSGGSKSSKSGK